MIYDKRALFLDKADVSGTGEALAGDVMSIPPSRDLGNGKTVYVAVAVTEEFVGGTSVEVKLWSDDTATIAVGAGATQHGSTGAIPVAELKVGKVIMFSLPIGIMYEEFLGISVGTVGTTTAGSLTVGLTIDPTGWHAYPEGRN